MNFYIDFHFIYFFSQALFHHIYNATGLYRKVLYITANVHDLKGIFPLIDTYTTQISNLSKNYPLLGVCRLILLSTAIFKDM